VKQQKSHSRNKKKKDRQCNQRALTKNGQSRKKPNKKNGGKQKRRKFQLTNGLNELRERLKQQKRRNPPSKMKGTAPTVRVGPIGRTLPAKESGWGVLVKKCPETGESNVKGTSQKP